MVVSFLVCLALFVAVGVSSVFKSRGTKQDYYLASSSINPLLVGLSAVATNNSGYMFIGVIGYTYVAGLSSIWLMFGWILGDYVASIYVHSRLREATQRTGAVSYAGVLSNWYGGNNTHLARLIAIISLVFLLAYAGAQLVAGGKALHVLLGWPSYSGAIIGAVLVAVYCLAGGIRASIWTDAAQSVVMIVAMAVLMIVAVLAQGGVGSVVSSMGEIEGFLSWTPKDVLFPGFFGVVVFAVSWMFAGFSVIGQPHIMVRFMTLGSNKKMNRARLWYYLWFIIFYAMAIAVGMLARIYIIDTGSFDAELALPTMAQELLPPYLAGLMLAGIFAATMSTADSLVLSCSAAITHDLIPHAIEKTWLIKLATVVITLIALCWALLNTQSVFNMVIMSWSALASGFAPLLLAQCLGARPSQRLAVSAVCSGLASALIWRFLGWQGALYEGMIGILVGLLVIYMPTFFQAYFRAIRPDSADKSM